MSELFLESGRNLCLKAGAGAGKTGCLVHAYLGLLEGRPGRPALVPSQILAITFTNKAADEMRGRIQARLAEKASQAGPGSPWAARLAAVEWAPIVTIHSFCLSLLREFGALLGLDPEFAVLEASEFSSLLQEVIAELLRATLAQHHPCLGRLLGTYSLVGRHSLSLMLERLYLGLSTQGLSATQARENTAQAFAVQMARGPLMRRQLEEAVEAVGAALGQGLVKGKAKFALKVAQLMEVWPQARARLATDGGHWQTLEQLMAIFSGNWGKINYLRQQAATALQDLAGLANSPACALFNDDLLALAQQLEQDLERELARRAVLSFDHLLLLGLSLLRQHPLVLGQLQQRFRAIVVDEFQDVNPVQGRLVFVLAGLEDAAGQARQPQPGEDLPRLLLVGDPKQSIYAFRGADKKVFDLAQSRVETVSLGYNYRSHSELIKFFNKLIEDLFQFPEKHEMSREEFHVFSSDDQQAPPQPPPGASSPEQPAPALVEVLAYGELDAQAPLDQWRQAEAQALAWRITALLEEGFRPGQIAVLMRAMTRSHIYEQALEQTGVPYYTVGGGGFYQRPEVAHLALALRYLLAPGDDLALAGTLGSPLVGLDDASLLALAHPLGQEQERPLHQALGKTLPHWIAPEQRELWRQGQALLAWLRQWARRLTPAELLSGMSQARDLPALYLCSGGGEQRLANLRKLLENARAPLPPGGVAGFAQNLWQLANQPSQEPQAPLLPEGADVVRLMSVHQAKGLEFPVVILADLAATPPAAADLPLGPSGVLAAKPWDPERGLRLSSTLDQSLSQRARAVEAAEAARIFYVACTRARERLIFCLHGGQRQGPWGKWVAELVPQTPQAVMVSPGLPPTTVPAQPQPYRACLPDQPGPGDAQGAALVQRILEPQPQPLARVRASVSGLENWLLCPRLYLLTQGLGLDTALLPREGPPGPAREPSSASLGSLVHRALELADLQAGPGSLEPALLQVLAQTSPDPALAALAAQVARGWWETDLPRLLAQVPALDLHREKPFHLLLPGQGQGPDLELRGEFDLLARLPGGRWLLVDYKVSDHLAPAQYQTQMALYALALWQGQGRAGDPPQVMLCYLGRQGAQLREMALTPQDLQAWTQRALEAGQAIANLPPNLPPSRLPQPPDCAARACHLAGTGLCSGEE